jgi:hypothetical protein
LRMKNMTPLLIVLTALHFLPLRSPWLAIRNNVRCYGVNSPHFWDFGVQSWPNLHKIPQNMQIRPNLDPEISKVVQDYIIANCKAKQMQLWEMQNRQNKEYRGHILNMQMTPWRYAFQYKYMYFVRGNQ